MKKTALLLAVAAIALPSVSMAGGELQQYQATSSYSASTMQGAGAYPAAGAQYGYARPMANYYGSACPAPCGTQPYGYTNGGAGFGMRSDILTAGLLGLGIGYLIFH